MTNPRAVLLVAWIALVLPACGKRSAPESAKPEVPLLKNEIPASQLDAVVRAHYQGLGFMEQYEYQKAVDAFREVNERAPDWIPGAINLAIALLNDSGSQLEGAKKAGGPGEANFDRALALLNAVLRREPENLDARYCRGLILEFLGSGHTAEAHADFRFVADHDPTDGHALLRVGATLVSPTDPNRPAGPESADQLIDIYSKALDRNPYLITALYRLQQAYGWARRADKQAATLVRWRRLNPASNPAGPGDTSENFYGESGKHARIINPFPPAKAPTTVSPRPRFDPPEALKVALGAGERWVKRDDFQEKLAVVGRARARFGATVVSLDADGDGQLDLYLAAAVVGPKGVRDALLLSKGEGAFEDVSRAWGLPEDAPSLGVAAADFDADRRNDLFLCGPSGYRLLRNDGGERFEDVTARAGMEGSKALGLTARWLDLDQDGDLDLYVLNYTDAGHIGDALGPNPVPGALNAAFRNLGKPAPVSGRPQDNWAPIAVAPADYPGKAGLSLEFAPWPDSDALVGPLANHTAIAALDVDDDRDLDLILGSENAAPRLILNDRLAAFHAVEMTGPTGPSKPIDGFLIADLDRDGRTDLASLGGGRVLAWRNTTSPTTSPRTVSWEAWPVDARNWRVAIASDLDLDTWPDLVGLPTTETAPLVSWARNDGQRLVVNDLTTSPSEAEEFSGLALADLVGDALPELIVTADGLAPRFARNRGNGEHWLAIELGGRWKTSFDHMRTNPHGIGARVSLEGQGLRVNHDHTTPASGLGQSLGPVVLGLGKSPSIELVRLRWPDGTMQCELNQKADVLLKLSEVNRKTGSCPVLFTWNGERFVCLGDFLGGGGLGYLVAPGTYGQPDRDESVAIAGDQLRPVNGRFRLSITEPMDEVAYLDRLRLLVVDRPPGVSATPDERFAPEGPRPTGAVIAWKTAVGPVKATDLKGADVTDTLRAWDRRTVDGFRRLDGWIGYAEDHGIVLDFGDRLSKFSPDDRLVLCLAGWVEYPYSQTNYAAATAGLALRAPSVERLNDDGSWALIEPHAGYPAGLPRLTTLDLSGKLVGPRCILRLRTNMECYWDQAFLALRDREAERSLRQTRLPVSRAALGHRGYSREVSPDGRDPLLYDYDHVDPAPLAFMEGRLTRLGDVSPLLRDDDDQHCVVGPGDEVRLEFDAGAVPDLLPGWSRSYVLEAVGYCKDADPFTATSDLVGPLPWREMPAFPFSTELHRPVDSAYQIYLDTYQTRPSGGR